MSKTRFKAGPVAALLVLLAIVTYLAVQRRGLTVDQAENEAVGSAFKLEGMVLFDDYSIAAFLATIALFAFVMWTVLRANQGEDKATTTAEQSNADNTTAFR